MSRTSRRLLDIQGFDALDDALLARTEAWLRVAPALCAAVAAAGTALASPAVLWSRAAIAVAGTALPWHSLGLPYRPDAT